MNRKVTIGFVVAFALLAGVVVGLERFNVGQPAATAAATTDNQELAIFDFEDQQVQAFAVRSDEQTVRFVKDGDAWTVADSGEPANRITLTGFLIRMSQLKGTRSLGDGAADLQAYGLAEPRLGATAELADGTTRTLLFGERTINGASTYVKTADGDQVFLVPNTLVTDLERLLTQPAQPPTPTPLPATP